MLKLGLGGAKLVAHVPAGGAGGGGAPPPSGHRLDGKKLQRLVEVVMELEKHGREVRKKGVQFDKYLAQRRPADGLLPYARVFDPKRKQTVGVYKEDELKQWIADLKAKKADLRIWEDTDKLEDREGADVEVTTFKNKAQLEDVVREFEALGFPIASYFVSPKPAAPAGKPFDPAEAEKNVAPFHASSGDQHEALDAIKDLPEKLRKLGQKGLTVQRFKGLGEMNAEELWETTMDPARRTLLKVVLDDESAGEANRIFTILMGTKVEPRRDFIEKHAPEVTNLDV
jgi:DNA gyrase subunit B